MRDIPFKYKYQIHIENNFQKKTNVSTQGLEPSSSDISPTLYPIELLGHKNILDENSLVGIHQIMISI